MKVLIVVDMQHDFIDGSLGTEEAKKILPNVEKKIAQYRSCGEGIIFTRDTHEENYLETQEGKNLPVKHCIKDTEGWQIRKEIDELRKEEPIDKITFGSSELGNMLVSLNDEEEIKSITFIGLCTDICVISNAMLLKAKFLETPISVDKKCCAGVSIKSHYVALEAMKACQIEII